MKPRGIQIPCQGYSVAADWYEGSGKDILLVLIGYPSSRASYTDFVTHMVDKTGTSALVLEYSGVGESPFELKEIPPAQHLLEIIKTFGWLRAKYPEARINVIGTSYGGFLGTELTKYREVSNLVLRVPAIYLPEDFYTSNEVVNKDEVYLYRQDKVLLDSHPVFTRASEFTGKTLVVVHEFDEFIPRKVTDKYIKTFKADTYLAKGFTHAFKVDAPDQDRSAYKNAISNWLNKH
jgi:alpha/beta superfamily hydrolase